MNFPFVPEFTTVRWIPSWPWPDRSTMFAIGRPVTECGYLPIVFSVFATVYRNFNIPRNIILFRPTTFPERLCFREFIVVFTFSPTPPLHPPHIRRTVSFRFSLTIYENTVKIRNRRKKQVSCHGTLSVSRPLQIDRRLLSQSSV